MSLSLDEVKKVAKLARLELSEADLQLTAARLNSILDYVDQLKQVDTTDVETLAHPLPIHNVFRDDEPTPSLPINEALKNAPTRAGNYFGVPAVFDASDEMTA
jgi:aspartyl-tRNA(Asn)/glutamyl-tRNA(Gln) amidotransferase subunit C